MKRLTVLAAAIAAAICVNAQPVKVRERLQEPQSGSRTLELRAKTVATPADPTPSEARAKAAAAHIGERLGMSVGEDDFRLRRKDADRFGRTHARLVQLYKGVEVDGRELVVHFDVDGVIYEVNGDCLDGLDLGVEPAVEPPAEGATLVIYCKGDDAAQARLAWKSVKGGYFVFTDAVTGKRLHRRRAMANAFSGDGGQGQEEDDILDLDALINKAFNEPMPQGVAVSITGNLPVQHGGAEVTVGAIETEDGSVYLATRNPYGVEIGVLDGIAAPKYRDAARAALSVDDEAGRAWFESYIADTTWTAHSDREEEDSRNSLAIVYNVGTVLEYYKEAFDRMSYDGKGGRVAAWRFMQIEAGDIDTAYANAFWASFDDAANTNGCFFFGYDLSGERSETSLDTCAHELTHGITSWSANLQYEGEPGALNESFSDVVAAAVEFAAQPRAKDATKPNPGEADWLFDEDSGKASRSYAEPQLYDQPSRYKGTFWASTFDTSEDNDDGGVHVNSGVQNHFFYLLCEGGEGVNDGIPYSLKGIGVEKAVQIAYLALTAYCTPTTDYSTIAGCWDSAAQDLVASGVIDAADHAELSSAWAAVLEPGDAEVFTGEGEAVYAYDAEEDDESDWPDGLHILVKTGKANSRGRLKVSAKVVFGGKAKSASAYCNVSRPEVSLALRGIGELAISLSASVAAGEIAVYGERRSILLPRVSPVIGLVSGLDDLRVGVMAQGEVEVDGDDDAESVRFSAKKLPAGVKIDAKTGTISGVPTKAKSGTATLSAKCKYWVEGEKRPVSTICSAAEEWEVAPLDAYAQGRFSGENVSFSVGKTGKLTGSATVGGRKVKLAAKSYIAYEDGTYICDLPGCSIYVDPDGATVYVSMEGGGEARLTAVKK